MTKRTVPDMKELFKQAAEIAQQVPESMQEAAFNRALDLLVGEATAEAPTKRPSAKRQERGSTKTPPTAEDPSRGAADRLVQEVDSTQHPGVRAASKVLDQALLVLQIALNEHKIDGLTPPEIARILKEKFRLNTSRQAVGMALKDATHLVDRTSEGRGYRYRIMAPGEEYLAHTDEEADSDAPRPAPQLTQRKKKPKRRSPQGKASVANVSERTPARPKRAKGKTRSGKRTVSGKVGPKAAILALLDKGYLDQPRSGPEIQRHLDRQKGIKLGTDQIRMAMLRLVRDEELQRNERDDGQYEYTKL